MIHTIPCLFRPEYRERSEIYGFLSLNGAGKTTTIRILLGKIGSSLTAAIGMLGTDLILALGRRLP